MINIQAYTCIDGMRMRDNMYYVTVSTYWPPGGGHCVPNGMQLTSRKR